MTKPLASLSLDLDNKWSYLKTHGDRGWDAFPSYLDRVVPCFLELLDGLGLRITVFIVGQDAALTENQHALASISAASHEIGNHSFHHEPWLHLYSPEEIEREISEAEDAIVAVTGQRLIGFRGPGYSSSPAVLACLASRGYRYDASSLPTIVGPLARAYYFMTARLSPEQRSQRKQLFGGMSAGLKPLSPYWWRFRGAPNSEFLPPRLLEIPVTTLPLLRVPIHFSYILFLAEKSAAAAWAYWRTAMTMCRVMNVEPSLLLHPLDVLGGDEEPQLAFFPAMGMAGQAKRRLVKNLLADFQQRFDPVTLAEHAASLAERKHLPVRNVEWPDGMERGARPVAETRLEAELTMEAQR
jgi:peptidoglycan-N-acetylglucosamine deacetylase